MGDATIVSLDTAIIFTRDMRALATFYELGLGLPPFGAEGDRHLGQPLGPVYFGFDEVDGKEATGHGAVTLWFTVDDLEAVFARFVSLGAGVRFTPIDKPWGARLAAVTDPDGNVVGLSQRLAADG